MLRISSCVETGRPWTIAKWAMTLDGKIATRTGESRWISCKAAQADRARPARTRRRDRRRHRHGAGRRSAADGAAGRSARGHARSCSTPTPGCHSTSQLVRTGRRCAGAGGDRRRGRGRATWPDWPSAGCEVVCCAGDDHRARLDFLLAELGRRRMTNVLVEGGGEVLGSLLDLDQIDEVHVFIAPEIVRRHGGPRPAGRLGMRRDRRSRRVGRGPCGNDRPGRLPHAAACGDADQPAMNCRAKMKMGPAKSGPIQQSCLVCGCADVAVYYRRNRRSSSRSSPCRAIWLSSRVRVLA